MSDHIGDKTLRFEINRARMGRFYACAVLFLMIVGSFLYNLNTKGFDWKVAISHLVAFLLVLSVWDRKLAAAWFQKLSRLKGR